MSDIIKVIERAKDRRPEKVEGLLYRYVSTSTFASVEGGQDQPWHAPLTAAVNEIIERSDKNNIPVPQDARDLNRAGFCRSAASELVRTHCMTLDELRTILMLIADKE